MKTTIVKRYNCDHCNKKGFAIGPMRKHEERCTLNPVRLCGMCNLASGESKKGAVVPPLTIPQMVAMLPNPKLFPMHFENYTEDLTEAVQFSLPALRAAVKNCPACIMAAIRQAKIPVPCSGFDFKAECRKRWSEVMPVDQW